MCARARRRPVACLSTACRATAELSQLPHDADALHVPVINIPRGDLELRTEACRCRCSASMMTCR